MYEDLGGGRVRVEDPKTGNYGIFTWDGSWLEGDVTHADLHMLVYIGGKDLPEGKDRYWAMTPPIDLEDEVLVKGGGTMLAAGQEIPRVVAMYKADPGKETPQGMRSAGHVELQFLIDNDRKPDLVPDVYRLESPMPGGPLKVDTARFYEQRYHDLEVERIWRRTWQLACREDDIPNVGDYIVYRIAHLSFLVVRTADGGIQAHQNVCLHRGRTLREEDGKCATEFRCPYHGWSWRLDGSLKEITCEWDFPGVREDTAKLPAAKVATWAGSVFINPDPEAEPLEDFLGPVMMEHYRKFKLENRYKQAHVRRVMHANWKVVMEAFMESYHVIATHPQMMLTGGDSSNIRYDVFGNWGRGGHLGVTSISPQRDIWKTEEEQLAEYRYVADLNADFLRGVIGDEVDQYSDAELNDGSFNDLFPNCHPWGGWARIIFRFLPNGSNPNESLMDVMLLAPWPEGKPKAAPAKMKLLAVDEPWTTASELGSLAKIIDQDCLNLPYVQEGLRAKQPPYIWYSAYQESKIRHFHTLYDKWMNLPAEGE
jgi:nitrite reductase/ring-hydroxylating ferredoxin subunit